MYFPEDEKIAEYLQKEFDYLQQRKVETEEQPFEKENQNPVDSILEIADPTPSIHDLFVKFDKKFFWSSLGRVQVSWSNRMTTCAGMCYFEGKFGACKISLSAPLLSFRPRKDLVQTLLHEMIHAYLFVTNNYRDRDDHGTEFHKHMFRINNEAGTNITVYHSFHDEVDYYKQHIWRCNGPCRFKKPYFGFLKRAQNKAPGPKDLWWSKHQSECNGTFIKISEPEKKTKNLKNSKVKKVETNVKDIRNFVQQIPTSKQISSNIVTLADFSKTTNNGLKSGTITVVNRKNCDKTEKSNKLNSNNSSSKNSNSSDRSNNRQKKKTINRISDSVLEEHFSNNKYSASNNINESVNSTDSEKVKEIVRNIWCNKFLPKLTEEKVETKKTKLDHTSDKEPKNSTRNYSNKNLELEKTDKEPESSSSTPKNNNELKHCPICNVQILQSEMNEHLENCVNCSFINCFDDDDFEKEKNEDVQEIREAKESEKQRNIENKDIQLIEEENEVNCDSVPCPCCGQWLLESEMNSHLDECLTLIAIKEEVGKL